MKLFALKNTYLFIQVSYINDVKLQWDKIIEKRKTKDLRKTISVNKIIWQGGHIYQLDHKIHEIVVRSR